MKKTDFISLSAHVLLIVLLSYHRMYQTLPPTHFGNLPSEIIKAYVMAEAPAVTQTEETKETEKTKETNNEMAALKKNIVHITAKTKPVQEHVKKQAKASLPKQSSQGISYDGLKALLHQAIQKQQYYPDSAQQLQRQGRVTVQFKLYPDGHIDQPIVHQSSGTPILDDAALKAVSNAAPFQGISTYLTKAKEFNIDVVFELT